MTALLRWDGDRLGATVDGARVRFTTRALDLRDAGDRDALATEVGRALRHGRQVHGARVLVDADPGREADGRVVTGTDAAALVLTADCLPIALLADGAVAMLHGGWRGLAAGVVDAGVRALRDAGALGPVVAVLGPSARGCCYAVGEEVHGAFAAYDARVGERNLALDVVATAQLRAAGVEAVHDAGACTLCDARFFSHRRGDAGRQGGLAWRA